MHTEKYDVAIIGAGIGGLVCGCYLAKAGLKTIIIEKNKTVGGYCSSFTRGKYSFDACVHAFSSYREQGVLYRTIKDLGINQIKIGRKNPSDIIVTPDFKIKIYNDLPKAIKEFQSIFPKEKKSIEDFFTYIVKSSLEAFIKSRRMTFRQILDKHFTDSRLKTILSLILLGLVGTDAHELSSVVGCLIYKEFIFDGGYYPQNCIQDFPDSLLEKYKEFHGEIITAKTAKKMTVNDHAVEKVILNDHQEVSAKYFVSACDAKYTLETLIGENALTEIQKIKIKKLKPSLSAFLVYLGLEDSFAIGDDYRSNIWVIQNYDYDGAMQEIANMNNDFLAITSPYAKSEMKKSIGKTLCLSTITLYKDPAYWRDDHKAQLADKLVARAEKIIPGLSKSIKKRVIASPHTLYKWTFNYQGAAYGWASTVSQFCDPDISQKTSIPNLYLSGHWANLSSGVTSVINCGFNVANLILQKEKK